ncbi:hypothetical protein BGZ46_002500 [Entomortierella lignicola]|nr:hypothetical protein BGZ46_002500 [Entomortierella lignicola]
MEQADLDSALCTLAERELELGNSKAAFADCEHACKDARAAVDGETSSHVKTKLELRNMKDALANSERARQEANANRFLPRPPREQEVFVVIRLQTLQPRYRIFTIQRQTVDRVLKQFIDDNAELNPVEVKEMRFDPSPRGENVIQHMRRDKEAPIKVSNRSFILRDDKSSEPEMIEYITKVFNTYTKDSPTAIREKKLARTSDTTLIWDTYI